jgi:excisionase family DNA binding protein
MQSVHFLQQPSGSLSPKDFAAALGVSESSVKRWVDDGQIRALRTPGGHRRIAVSEAIRFVRATAAPLPRPDLLGLRELRSRSVASASDLGDVGEAFHLALVEGRALEARALIVQAFVAGASAAVLCDGPLRSALTRIGDLWHHDQAGVFVEHRATAIVVEVLSLLRTLLVLEEGAPRAVGCAPAGDPYAIPTLAVATVLASEGFDVTNLGPETPMLSLVLAVERVKPKLVWVSASTAPGAEAVLAGLESVQRAAHDIGATIAIGGRSFETDLYRLPPEVFHCRAAAELAAFARGLQTVGGSLDGPRGAGGNGPHR